MSLEASKDLVRRFYREAINERDSSACERLLSEDFVHNGEAQGRAGEFLGVEATGREVEFTSTAVLRVRDGLIAQAWDEMDAAGLLRQLS